MYAEAYKQRYLIAPKYVQCEKVAGARVYGQTEVPSLYIKQEYRLIVGYIVSISTIRGDDTQPQTLQWRFLRGLSPHSVETEERISTSKSC